MGAKIWVETSEEKARSSQPWRATGWEARREARKKRALEPTEDQVLSGISGLTHLCGSARQCGLYLGTWQGNRMIGLAQMWKFYWIAKGQSAAVR